jgi:AraC-like DNA-binding protein
VGIFRSIEIDTKNKWFLSYLLVLCVPIFICVALWFHMRSSINKERIDKGYLQMTNVVQKVEAEAEANTVAANYFKRSEAVTLAEALTDVQSAYNKNIVRTLSESIDAYLSQTDSKDIIFIYLSNSDVIVTSDGYYAPYKYWSKHYADGSMSFTQWKEAVQKKAEVKYELYSLAFRDKNGAESRRFLHTTLIQKTGGAAYSVVAVQNADAIDHGGELSETYLMIYDDSGEWVYTSGNLDKETLPALYKSKNNEIFEIGKKRYMVSYETSEKLGFRFVAAVRLYDVFQDSFIPLVYGGVILISSFFCVWLLRRLTKKNYTVIDRIVTRLRRFRGEISSTNEIATINYLIDKMIRENQERDRLLFKQKNQFTMLNVSRLLRGRQEVFEDVQNGLAEADRLTFLSDYFAAVVIIVEDYKDFSGAGGSRGALDGGDLARFAIKNVSEEVFAEKGNKAYFADMEETAALLVSIAPENLEAAKEILTENCKFIQTFLKQQLSISTTITISNIGMGLHEIQAVYRQALEIAEYKYVLGEELIITPDDIDIQEDVRYGYTHERERLLSNLLKSGDCARAVGLIHDVLEFEDERRLQDIKRVQCMAYDIAATLIRFGSEAEIDESVFNENDFLEAVFNAKNPENIKKLIVAAARRICEDQQSKPGDFFTGMVSDYIEEVYSDHNLSVSKIAGHFNCHLAYLSNRFKEKTGIGMLEYINKLRVDKSTELLLTTEYSINDISEKVGYINTNTYIRIFKKIMGVTPNKYRSMKR